MSTLTKEWLQQKIAEMEAARDEIPFGLDEDDSNALSALRIALASLEAEPVYQVYGNNDDTWSDVDEEEMIRLRRDWEDIRTLYTAPPAPVSVPDSLLSELLTIAKTAANAADECAHAEFGDDSMEHSTAISDWERRAAMLHGADGNSPVIPDGWVMVPVEPTQVMMNAWLSEVANWRGHAAGYRAMIAAAPQQEVK